MTRDDIAEATRSAVGERVRAAVKAVLEQIHDEEMVEHGGARGIGNGPPPGRASATAVTAVI